MGNCMESSLPRQHLDEVLHGEMEITVTYPQNQRPEADEKENVQDEVEEVTEIGGSVRVKIVLTKEELQWLMMQLKSDGQKRLKNVLEEIERGRKKVICYSGGKNCIGWKPSLESIMEIPEVHEMNRSMKL